MQATTLFFIYCQQYEYESTSECELNFKSNLENILLAIDKKRVVACIVSSIYSSFIK